MKTLDNYIGVITDIGKTVRVALYNNSNDEFYTDWDKNVFSDTGVPLRIDEGFEFCVKKYKSGKEIVKISPLPRKRLTKKEVERVDKEITELLK